MVELPSFPDRSSAVCGCGEMTIADGLGSIPLAVTKLPLLSENVNSARARNTGTR